MESSQGWPTCKPEISQFDLVVKVGDLLRRLSAMTEPGFVEVREFEALQTVARTIEERYADYVDEVMVNRIRQQVPAQSTTRRRRAA